MSQQTMLMPLSTTQERVTVRQGRPRRFNLQGIIAMAVLFFFTAYFLIPYFWLIVSSTKNAGDLFGTFGLWFAPNFNLWSNLQQLLTYQDSVFTYWLINTLLYAGVGAGVSTWFSAMAGYALSKYVFRGRNLLFSLVLGAILVPATALVLPLYLMMSKVGLTNTYWAVLLPSFVNPFGVYLIRIYVSAGVPDELLEAARIDGANEYQAFTIALHLMIPALVTVFLFQFVAIWNNYFLPLVMLSDEKLFPITVGLQTWNVTVAGTSKLLYSLIITGALVSSIPLLAGCVVLQRFWRGGLNAGSIKS
ncbi:MAG TPA: carbohydrate ABC transporter permease [Ktedonosporobacter sp.]|nr:carbohydrate ABC transporter permease [Ktedonosporobacter sp.]